MIEIKYPRAKPLVYNIQEIQKAFSEILSSGKLTQGEYVSMFEEEMKNYIGCEYALATSSCTSALEMAIRSLNIEDNKIIVPTNTWMSTANVVILTKNIPVFVELDPDNLCPSIDDTLRKIRSEDIGGVIWVHNGGLVHPRFQEIIDECNNKGIYLIEDCAHALGSKYNGKKAGNLGDVGCFSFYPTKIIATGEGGMITTNNKEIFITSQILRNHGTYRNTGPVEGLDYGVTALYASQNFRMTEFAGVLGYFQLPIVDTFVEARNLIANYYNEILSSIEGITTVPTYNDCRTSYWQYYIILDRGIDREKVAEDLLYKHGIQTANAYSPPCHKQPVFEKYATGNYEVTEDILSRHLSLPIYVGLRPENIDEICGKVITVINEHRTK